jgi:hypothetical protein
MSEYTEYIRRHLNRTAPERIMSEDEFYKNSGGNIPPQKPAPVKRSLKLTKNGRIFVTFYVLLTAIVASILIAVNTTFPPPTVDAGNVTESITKTQEIAPMTLERGEEAEVGWFERWCR